MKKGAINSSQEFERFYQSNSRTCVVKYFSNESQAYLYSARLTEAGIQNFISNTNMSTIIPLFGGIGIHVKESDREEAWLVFDQMDKSKALVNDFHEADREDILYEKEISEGGKKKHYNLFFALSFLILLILIRSYFKASGVIPISLDFF